MIEGKAFILDKRLLYSVCIIFFSILFLGAVSCFVFYRYAAVYENTRPELKMDELMSTMSAEDWFNSTDKSTADTISVFENTEEIFSRFYKTTCINKNLSYRKSFYEKDKVKFVVEAEGVSLYEVTLQARDDIKPGFGRHYWKLESIKLADFASSLENVTVEVYAEADNRVFINSIPVDDKYYTGDLSWAGLCDLSERFSSNAVCRKYSIGKMFGDITVTDFNGNIIEAEYDTKTGAYRYICPPVTYSVTIEAPEDMTVVLCGQELNRNDASVISDSLFNNLTSFTNGSEWQKLVYSFDNIYGIPTVLAFDKSGNEIHPVVTDSGRILFFHKNDEELQKEAESSVESFFNANLAYSSFRGGSYKLLDRLLECTYRGTRLYRYFRYSTEGMYWASDTEINNNELEFSNFYRLNENCLFCTVQFKGNCSAQTWYENYSYELKNGYEMLFVRYGNGWLAAEMSAFA